MMPDRALFIGRFQPFHHGHKEVVETLLKSHGQVIIAIGSAEAPPSGENPFTAGERIEMIRAAFGAKELRRLIIIPIRDVNDHSTWARHVRSYVPDFRAVCTNNALVTELFKKDGAAVEPVEYFDRGPKEGRLIRRMMAEGKEEWRKHVPEGTAGVIEAMGGVERVKRLLKG
jgi:nicotinamide-nucleotide adenylyltransferase